jgi:hypothetical protein
LTVSVVGADHRAMDELTIPHGLTLIDWDPDAERLMNIGEHLMRWGERYVAQAGVRLTDDERDRLARAADIAQRALDLFDVDPGRHPRRRP